MLPISIQNDVQVLDVKVLELDAVLTIQSLLEKGVVSVDIVENFICIFLLTCSENYDFVPLNQLLENILHVWAQSNLDLSAFEGELESRFKSIGNVSFELSGDQSLIHIEDKKSILCLGT